MSRYELIAEIYDHDDPHLVGVDLMHAPHMPSLERSEAFWSWIEANGFRSEPDIWINLVAPGDQEYNEGAIDRRAWPVNRHEFESYRKAAHR